jgi:TPR repeat protein
VTLGAWLEQPELGRDYARAAIAYQKGCEGNEQKGCASLARLYKGGLGVAVDTAKAESLAIAACEKDAETCESLAAIVIEKAPARAVAPLDRACQARVFRACTELGIHHAAGRGIPLNLPRAVVLLEKACAGDDARGCKTLADLIEFGTVGAPEPRRAAALRRKACAAGYQLACRQP